MKYKINGYVITNPGKIRQNNEDNFSLFGEYRKDVDVSSFKLEKAESGTFCMAAVFDGMGGEEAGEEASLAAAESINMLTKKGNLPSKISAKFNLQGEFKEEIKKLILTVNKEVCQKSIELGKKRIGSTIASIYFAGNRFVAANVGDSRCYLVRNDRMSLLSHDHSIGQRMIDTKEMTEEEARKNKSWHALTQNLGIFEDEFCIEPYFSDEMELKENDLFILCSDGLTDMLADSEIKAFVSPESELKDTAEKLIEAALDRGGKDNVTVMILRAYRDEGGFNKFLNKLKRS